MSQVWVCCAGAMSATLPRGLLVPAGVVALLAVQVLVLYTPQSGGPPSPIPHGDKVVHALVFAAPVLVAGLAKGAAWQAVAFLSAVHAPVSEVIQHLALPTRSGDAWDVVADLVGVGMAAAGVAWWFRRPRRRRL